MHLRATDKGIAVDVAMCRLYFNQGNDLPWSVDSGVGTDEYQAKEVIILNLTAKTRCDAAFGSVPKSWIQFGSGTLVILKQTIVIT